MYNQELKYLLKIDQTSLSSLAKETEEIKVNDLLTSSSVLSQPGNIYQTCLFTLKSICACRKFNEVSYNISSNKYSLKKNTIKNVSKSKK